MRKPGKDGKVLMHSYTFQQLRDIWDFCQHDFDRFISLLEWLEDLS